ncbi:MULTISPECIES: hypothetical protein [unclassified Streptomyces]|uniref:hypothetical protein n=1 Tax=unclassified Streptomyces TaxID=2593676 RepID=UPI00081DD303|nr:MULTISPECIES: hypothetical protein [unclassified Streptomyces]MYZ37915.1 hypothetical protein [Streptomyces sp. SID4917]SCF95146.1 hypothetical protein GA0115259_105473 [Streptomyces sp. MnatMP-M17]
MPVGHNGVNHVRAGRASLVPDGTQYRGVPVPSGIDPADWSPRGRYQLRAWCARVDARLSSPVPELTGEAHRT